MEASNVKPFSCNFLKFKTGKKITRKYKTTQHETSLIPLFFNLGSNYKLGSKMFSLKLP